MVEIKKYKFSSLYDFSSGISTKPEQAGFGAPFLSFSSVYNNYFVPNILPDLMDTSKKEQEKFSIFEGDIFLTRTSEVIDELGISSVAIRDYPFATYSGFVKRLRPLKDKLTYPKYMAFYLRSELFRKTMTNNAVLTLRASLNEQIFSYLDLLLPSYEYQKKYGDLLFSFNQKIEINNKTNSELEKIGKILYDYWFVQFDFPDENRRPYKSSGGKMVWSDELKREIPERWEVENLKKNSLAKLIKPGIDFFENVKTYLATADVQNNDINFQANKITFEKRESRANMQPIKNSIWFAKMKNSKKVLYFGEYSNYLLENFILSTGFAGLECNKKYFLEYIWGFINNDNFEFIKDRLSNGATQEAINNDGLEQIKLVIPNDEILRKYHEKTYGIYKKIYLNQIENQKLAELRDWLLPMLMNGQVSVK